MAWCQEKMTMGELNKVYTIWTPHIYIKFRVGAINSVCEARSWCKCNEGVVIKCALCNPLTKGRGEVPCLSPLACHKWNHILTFHRNMWKQVQNIILLYTWVSASMQELATIEESCHCITHIRWSSFVKSSGH